MSDDEAAGQLVDVEVYTFLGTVYPPRAALRGAHVKTSQGVRADVAIAGPRVAVTMRVPVGLPGDPMVHRNSAEVIVQNYLDAQAFALGTWVEVHIDTVILPDLHMATFTEQDFVIDDDELREAVRRALVETQDGHVRVALSDISAALRHAQDAAMHCYRAIESAHQYFIDATGTDPAWETMRTILGVNRALLESVRVPAGERRHGRPRGDVSGEHRRDFISVARLVTWRLVRHILSERGQGELLAPIGGWEPELTPAMRVVAQLADG